MLIIILFLLSIFIEIFNDINSQILLKKISIFELLFIRNFLSFIILKLIFFKNKLDLNIFKNIIYIYILINIIKYNIFIFIFYIFIFRNRIKVIIKDLIIIRSFFTFLAFFLTTKAIENLKISDISSAYYSIPIFSSILSIILNKEKINKKYWFEFIILCNFIIFNINFNAIYMLLGCFCFSISDILIQNSEKNIIDEIIYISFALSLYFCSFIEYNNINLLEKFNENYIQLSFIIIGNIAIQLIIFYIFKKVKFSTLMPFRFFSLIISNFIDGKILSFWNIIISAIILFRVI